jgi:hypothetical protein
MSATRAALAGVIDYAGLFPPASLDLPRVVANHVRYAHSDESWLLGRLIVPLARLGELDDLLDALAVHGSWTISALAQLDDIPRVEALVRQFNERHAPRWAVVAIELGAASPAEVHTIAGGIPERYERYVEVPLDDRLPAFLDAIAATGCYAKARTGGTRADAFPAADLVARFITQCISREVPCKATAGLHHPIRGSYRLTYEPQSPTAVMHGFVNLIAAAGLLKAGAVDEHEAAAILDVTDPGALELSADRIRLGPHELDAEACTIARAHVLRSIGSCSFEDAIADLRTLRWLGAEGGRPGAEG